MIYSNINDIKKYINNIDGDLKKTIVNFLFSGRTNHASYTMLIIKLQSEIDNLEYYSEKYPELYSSCTIKITAIEKLIQEVKDIEFRQAINKSDSLIEKIFRMIR